jgi:hypothetical protein
MFFKPVILHVNTIVSVHDTVKGPWVPPCSPVGCREKVTLVSHLLAGN